MINPEPETHDLAENDRIWVHPGGDVAMKMDLPEDYTAGSATFQYEERDWSYQPHQHTEVTSGSWTDADAEVTLKVDKLDILIPAATVKTWKDRTIEGQVVLTHGGRTWVAADILIIVAQGS